MIIYRPATKTDKKIIATLMIKASGGLIEYLLDGLDSDLTSRNLVAFEVARNESPLSYKNCLLAEYDGSVIGMVCCYSVKHLNMELNGKLDAKKSKVMAIFNKIDYPDSLYIDTICVSNEFRRKNIGTKLLAGVCKFVTTPTYKNIILYVWSDNRKAIKFYEDLGFCISKRVSSTVTNFPIKHDRLLMVCSISKLNLSFEKKLTKEKKNGKKC